MEARAGIHFAVEEMIAFRRLPSILASSSQPPQSMFFSFSHFCLDFGILSIVFGLLGYWRAKSKASLIAGGISGGLLILSYFLNPPYGLYLGLGVCVLLTGRFLPAFLKNKKIYPAGIMAILALIGTIMGVLHLFQK